MKRRFVIKFAFIVYIAAMAGMFYGISIYIQSKDEWLRIAIHKAISETFNGKRIVACLSYKGLCVAYDKKDIPIGPEQFYEDLNKRFWKRNKNWQSGDNTKSKQLPDSLKFLEEMNKSLEAEMAREQREWVEYYGGKSKYFWLKDMASDPLWDQMPSFLSLTSCFSIALVLPLRYFIHPRKKAGGV